MMFDSIEKWIKEKFPSSLISDADREEIVSVSEKKSLDFLWLSLTSAAFEISRAKADLSKNPWDITESLVAEAGVWIKENYKRLLDAVDRVLNCATEDSTAEEQIFALFGVFKWNHYSELEKIIGSTDSDNGDATRFVSWPDRCFSLKSFIDDLERMTSPEYFPVKYGFSIVNDLLNLFLVHRFIIPCSEKINTLFLLRLSLCELKIVEFASKEIGEFCIIENPKAALKYCRTRRGIISRKMKARPGLTQKAAIAVKLFGALSDGERKRFDTHPHTVWSIVKIKIEEYKKLEELKSRREKKETEIKEIAMLEQKVGDKFNTAGLSFQDLGGHEKSPMSGNTFIKHVRAYLSGSMQ